MESNNIQVLACKKIQEELEKYRNELFKMQPQKIYFNSGVSIFTEATVAQLNLLTKDKSLCELILDENKTLENAVQYIISKVRNKYGMSGDLPVKEFQGLIWEYYKIDPQKAKDVLNKKIIHHEKPEQKTLFDYQNKSSATKKEIKNVKKPDASNVTSINKKSNGPGPLQMSLFDFGGGNNA
jgi:hypothetical protein